MPITYPSPSLLQPMLLVLLLSDDDDRVGLRHGRHRGHGHKSSRELFTASFSVLFLCHVGLLGYISWWWWDDDTGRVIYSLAILKTVTACMSQIHKNMNIEIYETAHDI